MIQHLSIGYEVAQWRDGTDANGTRTRTAVKWTIREASFVAIPADRTAHTRNAPGSRASINRAIRELCSRRASASVADDLIDHEASVEDGAQRGARSTCRPEGACRS